MNCRVVDLGCIDYLAAYQKQKQAVAEVMAGQEQIIFLCEHPSVLTLGRLAKTEHILIPREDLQRLGVSVHEIDRGGEVTLHSPGQLVVYPILDLRNYKMDLHWYLHQLEQAVIAFLKEFAILSDRLLGKTGVWVAQNKIASIGVGVKKWITFHGLAVNANTDLNLFSLIKPCGLDVQMTSIEKIKGQSVEMSLVKEKMLDVLTKSFHLRCEQKKIS